jgi:hypothetical protein
MQSQLADALGLKHPPIAILLTDTRPEGAIQFKPGRMGCVAAMLLTAAGGRPVCFDVQTFGCPGGGAGLGFGDCYARWLAEFPFRQIPTAYLVAKRLADTSPDEPIALVHWYVNPDQLAALVTLAGFERGTVETAIAPWGAACQSIAYAFAEAERPRPRGVIGLFDVSKRGQVDREIMSLTAPYVLHREMEAAIPDSFLRTEVWQKLRARQ